MILNGNHNKEPQTFENPHMKMELAHSGRSRVDKQLKDDQHQDNFGGFKDWAEAVASIDLTQSGSCLIVTVPTEWA